MGDESGTAAPERPRIALRPNCPRCGASLSDRRMRCTECGITYRAATHERDHVAPFAIESSTLKWDVIRHLILLATVALYFIVLAYPPVTVWSAVMTLTGWIGLVGLLWTLWRRHLRAEKRPKPRRRSVR